MTENGNNLVMPVSPMGGYGNGGLGGFGGDWGWIVLLLLLAGGGWGMGGFGGFGGMMGMGFDFPWLLTGQNGINNNVSDGFRSAQLSDSVTSVRDGISNLATQLCGCCGDMQMALANGFAGVNSNIAGAQSAISMQLCNNEIASLNRSFAEQTANTAGFNGIQSGLCDIRYGNATNTQSILTALTAGVQSIKDDLCAERLSRKDDEIAQLRQEVLFARGQASQIDQTAQIRAGQAATANQLVTEMRACPIPAVPVYGDQRIFSCNNSGSGCGCGGFAN